GKSSEHMLRVYRLAIFCRHDRAYSLWDEVLKYSTEQTQMFEEEWWRLVPKSSGPTPPGIRSVAAPRSAPDASTATRKRLRSAFAGLRAIPTSKGLNCALCRKSSMNHSNGAHLSWCL